MSEEIGEELLDVLSPNHVLVVLLPQKLGLLVFGLATGQRKASARRFRQERLEVAANAPIVLHLRVGCRRQN